MTGPGELKTVDTAAILAEARHLGPLAAAAGVRRGRAGAPSRGTVVEIWLQIHDDMIAAAAFLAFGEPAAVACAEWACSTLEGHPLSVAEEVSGLAMVEALGLPQSALGAALTVEDALRAAVAA